jgi:hypothetical protein
MVVEERTTGSSSSTGSRRRSRISISSSADV